MINSPVCTLVLGVEFLLVHVLKFTEFILEFLSSDDVLVVKYVGVCVGEMIFFFIIYFFLIACLLLLDSFLVFTVSVLFGGGARPPSLFLDS